MEIENLHSSMFEHKLLNKYKKMNENTLSYGVTSKSELVVKEQMLKNIERLHKKDNADEELKEKQVQIHFRNEEEKRQYSLKNLLARSTTYDYDALKTKKKKKKNVNIQRK